MPASVPDVSGRRLPGRPFLPPNRTPLTPATRAMLLCLSSLSFEAPRGGRSNPCLPLAVLLGSGPGLRAGLRGSEAGSRVAVGWSGCGRAGRDAVERLAFGAAELVGDLTESVDEGGQEKS
jgi:hypothetical protein